MDISGLREDLSGSDSPSQDTGVSIEPATHASMLYGDSSCQGVVLGGKGPRHVRGAAFRAARQLMYSKIVCSCSR